MRMPRGYVFVEGAWEAQVDVTRTYGPNAHDAVDLRDVLHAHLGHGVGKALTHSSTSSTRVATSCSAKRCDPSCGALQGSQNTGCSNGATFHLPLLVRAREATDPPMRSFTIS